MEKWVALTIFFLLLGGMIALVSIVASTITANIITYYPGEGGKYTVENYNNGVIEDSIKEIQGSCEFVSSKDTTINALPFFNMTFQDICKKTYGFAPKAVVLRSETTLFNAMNCSPSYAVSYTVEDMIQSYKPALDMVRLGETVSDSCTNALFPDGSSNGGFSNLKRVHYEGILCCRA